MFNHMINHSFQLKNWKLYMMFVLLGVLFLSGCVSEELNSSEKTISKKIISNPITKEEDGIKVTISKIEFTGEYTRIYVKIENNRKTEISFNKYSSYLVQNRKKYDQTFAPFGVDVEEPDMDIPAGLITEGWIFFEPLNPEEPFVVHLELSDFEVFPPKEWRWDIEVK